MNKIFLLAACGAGMLLCTTGCNDSQKKSAPAGAMQKQPPPAVVAGKVVLENNTEKRSYTGVVVSPAVVTLMPRISGELVKVGFSEGQIVKKGQLLYEFDKTRYTAAVTNAEAKIAECKAKITETQAHISEAQARLVFAESDYKMKAGLRSKNATAQTELDNALSVRDAAQASYDAAKAANTAAESSLKAAEAQLTTARDDLDNCVITAPMDGVIGVNNFAVGNYITPSSGPLATINQITPIRVEFAMSNRDFLEMFGSEDKLIKEARIQLTLANDKLFDEIGTVEFIDNNINRSTDTIQVFATFKNTARQLRPGASVTVQIERCISKNTPAVPPSAVMPAAGGKFYVYVVDSQNMAEKREVEVSTLRSDLAFIKAGLNAGETIITDGTHKVRIMKPGAKFPVVPTFPAQAKK